MLTIRDADTLDVAVGAEGGGLLVAAFEPAAAVVALEFAAGKDGPPPSHVTVVSGVRRPAWWALVVAGPSPAAMMAEASLTASARAELADAAAGLGIRADIHVVPLPHRMEPVVAELLGARDYCLVAVGVSPRPSGCRRRLQRLCARAQTWCPVALVEAA